MLNGLRTEHLCDIIPKAQSWLVPKLASFHVCLHSLQCTPDQKEKQIWLEMCQMKRFIDMEQTPLSMFLLLSTWFVFSQLSLVSIKPISTTTTANFESKQSN